MKVVISIDAFELWCWRSPLDFSRGIKTSQGTLRVPWTARGSNQGILKEISPEYSLKGLILKLKLQDFGYLVPRAYCLEKP